MDNVKFHHCSEVRETANIHFNEIMNLPPYSPFLNPIENMFSKWNGICKRKQPKNEWELFEAIEDGATLITEFDCEDYFRNMWFYITKCLNNEEILK